MLGGSGLLGGGREIEEGMFAEGSAGNFEGMIPMDEGGISKSFIFEAESCKSSSFRRYLEKFTEFRMDFR